MDWYDKDNLRLIVVSPPTITSDNTFLHADHDNQKKMGRVMAPQWRGRERSMSIDRLKPIHLHHFLVGEEEEERGGRHIHGEKTLDLPDDVICQLFIILLGLQEHIQQVPWFFSL